MNMANQQPSNSRIREYLDLWANIISDRLNKLAHGPVAVQVISRMETSTGFGPKSEEGSWVRFATGIGGEQAFFISTEDAVKLSRLLHGSGTGDAAAEADANKTVQEVFVQAAADFTATAGPEDNLEPKFIGTGRPVWEGAVQATYCLSCEPEESLIVHIYVSAELASHLQSTWGTGASAEKKRTAISSRPSAATAGPASDVRLDLLMDVELEVALRFGQREMLLRDILSIAPGTVLELDQQVQDPVELLVGNKVVARGEVVTVDGNYGLRITSLASSEERIESLRM
jgi:flagellar motor switch protein FliN